MELKTVQTYVSKIKTKGHWKPLFKTRFVDFNYYIDDKKRYENDLRNKLFRKIDHWIVICNNNYPFNLGEDLEQLIVWIRDGDPGIDFITKLVEKHYPGRDYIVSLNQYQYRSIKSILHYHVILKEPSPPFYLEKLIIFHRHANRGPISKIPVFEKLRNDGSVETSNIHLPLLPIGHQNALRFGKDLREIYSLSRQFLLRSICFSSPYLRCIQTSQNVLKGLETNIDIIVNNSLKFAIDTEAPTLIGNLNESKCLSQHYLPLIKRLNEALQVEISDILEIHNIYSSIRCYRDLGIDVNQYLDPELEKELNEATYQVLNFFNKHCQKLHYQELQDTISFFDSVDQNLILCSTHDTLIFLLAKYYEMNNGMDYCLEIPDYLSNIRIEKWSDGVTRVYYNSFYLGKKVIV